MSYSKQEIKEGIKVHIINTPNFKTNLCAIFLTIPLSRQTITKNTLISSVLRRGTKNMNTQEEISKVLENMYGASFDCGIEKTGDNHILKFYLESLNDEFLPVKDNLLEQSINNLMEIVFNPLVEQNSFKEEYINGEKENLKQIINGKKDNKGSYALFRTIEEMYKDKPYGLYKYGYVEDLDEIHSKELYEYYKKMISECKIDIFISGDIDKEHVKRYVINNENIQALDGRTPNFIINNENTEKKEINDKPKEVTESMEVTQGNLIIGLDIREYKKESKHAALLYNAILGGTPTSKLFQNVREKASLAYSTSSNYVRQKNNIFIRCGIEISNYERAVNIIKDQLEDMEKGEFEQKDIDNSKNYIISTIHAIPDEQDTQITFYLGQELSDSDLDINEYESKIQNVSKEDVMNIAKKINMNTIYLLKD